MAKNIMSRIVTLEEMYGKPSDAPDDERPVLLVGGEIDSRTNVRTLMLAQDALRPQPTAIPKADCPTCGGTGMAPWRDDPRRRVACQCIVFRESEQIGLVD